MQDLWCRVTLAEVVAEEFGQTDLEQNDRERDQPPTQYEGQILKQLGHTNSPWLKPVSGKDTGYGLHNAPVTRTLKLYNIF